MVPVQYGDTGASWQSSGASAQVLPGNATPGNAVVLAVVSEDTSVTSITSGMGTFSVVPSTYIESGALGMLQFWTCNNVTGAADTITVTTGAGQNWAAFAIELPTVAAVSTGGTTSGTGATASETVSGLVSGDFVLAAVSCQGSITAAPSTPWTDYATGFFARTNGGYDVAWVTASGSSVTPSWTQSSAIYGYLLTAAIVLPAASPTVSSATAYSYGPTIEVVDVVVNPNGRDASVTINYGPTSGYGSTSGTVDAGAGISAVTVHVPVTGLTSGNTYHFQASATNSLGTATTSDATFTTVGMPNLNAAQGLAPLGASGFGNQVAPPTVSIAAADSYGPTIEVVLVNVSTGDAGTQIYLNYGLTTGYGSVSATVTTPSGAYQGPYSSQPVTLLFTGLGSQTWTCPPGVTHIDCECWAGGGSGGGPSSSSGAGGGGGGGEYAREPALAVTPGKTYTLVVGAGAAAAASGGNNGTSGSNSTFAGDSVTVTANGGGGGQYTSGAGTGGTGSSNTVHNNGGAGGVGYVHSPGEQGAGGGGSGGPASAGNAGQNGASTVTGNGAAAVTGGGPGGDGSSGTASGLSPTQGPGGGGGGGAAVNAGGAGANGQVRIAYTLVQNSPLTPQIPIPLTGLTVGDTYHAQAVVTA